jgi:hypothetical protein
MNLNENIITKNQQVELISVSKALHHKEEVIKDFNDSNFNRNINNQNYLYFLGGFIEGEGSNSVSVAIDRNYKFGVSLQPVFNVSQHKNGLNILYSFKELFGVGSVVEKSGSPDIFVYTVKGYKKMIDPIIPFLEKYVQPFSCKTKEYQIFKELVLLSEAGHQKNKDTLIAMVKLAYTFEGKGKYRKRSLDEIIEIINDKNTYFEKK